MSKKDSYWFRHDSTAGRGLKMRKMAHIYSHWGKGIYWDVVEILRDQDGYKFESDESSLQLLCDLVGCKDESRFINWFNDSLKIGLFNIKDGFFFCPPLCENMIRWESSKNNGSKGGRPSKKPKKNPTNNLDETIIEENSIEEDIIEDDINYETKKIIEFRDKFTKNNNFKDECLKSEYWIETIESKSKLYKGTVELFLNHFEDHLVTMDEVKKNLKEFKQHFVHWLNKQDLSHHKFKVVGKSNQI